MRQETAPNQICVVVFFLVIYLFIFIPSAYNNISTAGIQTGEFKNISLFYKDICSETGQWSEEQASLEERNLFLSELADQWDRDLVVNVPLP